MVEETHNSGAQKDAEAEVESFRKDLGPFVVAAETTRMPMVFTDAKEPGRPIIFANESFLKLTGYPREEVLAHSLTDLLAKGAQREALAEVEAEFAGASERDPEIHYRRKDGSEFWASVFVSPVRDDEGNVVQHFVSLVDLTKHKQEQSQSLLMIDELNHRVKNTLATVQSITWQALRKNSDAETIRESIESRLFALSRSHDLLTREKWEGASLRDLLHAALEPFGVANGRAERFVITGKDVRMTPKATLALSITINELATNAVKYGAFSNDAGSVVISWATQASAKGDRLVLTWQEKDGPAVKRRTHQGFGSQVIERGLAHELEGAVQLNFPPTGVVCTIEIPAPLAVLDE